MTTTEPPHSRRLPFPIRVIRARPRLTLSTLCGLVIGMLLPATLRWSTRSLIGWDVGVTVYLGLAYAMMASPDIARIKRRAAMQDDGAFFILVLTASAALASLGAIVVELGSGGRDTAHLVLAVSTIVLSWGFTHTMFALHYAHGYYDQRNPAGGLAFPGGEKPDYWDFVYFSLVIGMTSQVSDVAVTCKPIRRVVAGHGVISFFFNAALVALLVNIAANAVAGS
jgi:uncharacterized membrane protein